MSELLCEYQNTWAYNMEYGMSTEEIYGLDIVPYAIPSVNDEGVENTLALMYMGGISTSCEYPEEAYLLLKFMTWGIDGWQARLDIYEDESLTNEWGVAYKNWNMPTPLTTDNTVWSRYEGLFPQDEYKKLFWSDYFASITRPVPFSWCCIAGDANFEEYYLEAIGVSQVVMEGIANAMDYVDEMDRQITYYHGDAMLSYFGKNSIYDMLGYKVLTDEEEQIYRDIVDSMYQIASSWYIYSKNKMFCCQSQ